MASLPPCKNLSPPYCPNAPPPASLSQCHMSQCSPSHRLTSSLPLFPTAPDCSTVLMPHRPIVLLTHCHTCCIVCPLLYRTPALPECPTNYSYFTWGLYFLSKASGFLLHCFTAKLLTGFCETVRNFREKNKILAKFNGRSFVHKEKFKTLSVELS
jgi:hypothetical protein